MQVDWGGRLIDLKWWHSENAPDPIKVTESGNVIDVNESQSKKASF